jgi:hypothetical protein
MKKSFEINRNTDPNLLDLTLSDEEGFSIEITASTEKMTSDDRSGIKAFIMGYNMDHTPQLNFHVDDSCKKYVRVVGNISEALEFLKKNRFISDSLCSAIKSDHDGIELLNKSKSYIEPSLEGDELAMPDNPSDDEMMQGLGQAGNSSSDDEEKFVKAKVFFENSTKSSSQITTGYQKDTASSKTNSNTNKTNGTPTVKVK